MTRGTVGRRHLNQVLQALLNPSSPGGQANQALAAIYRVRAAIDKDWGGAGAMD